MTESAAYHVAVFAMDGSLIGLNSWKRAALSPKWLQIATQLVDSATQSGRAPLKLADHRPCFRWTRYAVRSKNRGESSNEREWGLFYSLSSWVRVQDCSRGERAGIIRGPMAKSRP